MGFIGVVSGECECWLGGGGVLLEVAAVWRARALVWGLGGRWNPAGPCASMSP